MSAGQMKTPDVIKDGCEPPCGYWELNSGPLEEQAVLLTTEPSLQPQPYISYALLWLNMGAAHGVGSFHLAVAL